MPCQGVIGEIVKGGNVLWQPSRLREKIFAFLFGRSSTSNYLLATLRVAIKIGGTLFRGKIVTSGIISLLRKNWNSHSIRGAFLLNQHGYTAVGNPYRRQISDIPPEMKN
jgi:hypothetical protein